MRTDGFLRQNWKITKYNRASSRDDWMKHNSLSYGGSVQAVIFSTSLKRYKAVKYILFHYSTFPILTRLPHLPLLQWIHKASEKSGKWCAYPLGSKLVYSYCSPEQQLRTAGNQVLVFLLALR